MKKLAYTLSVACALAALSACNNGNYDVNPNVNNGSSSNPLNPTGSTGTTGGGTTGGGTTGGGVTDFNYTGTDPMSATVGGAGFQAGTATISDFSTLNDTYITGGTSDYSFSAHTGASIAISVPIHPVPGTIYTSSVQTNLTYTDATQTGTNGVYSDSYGGSCAVKIADTSNGHIKGSFYGTVKNQSGGAIAIANGYFNVAR